MVKNTSRKEAMSQKVLKISSSKILGEFLQKISIDVELVFKKKL